MKTTDKLLNRLEKEILVLDGAMGTVMQEYDLKEKDFRGEKFPDHKTDLKGNNDILSLTRPGVISQVHNRYLDAGADIITTNTFNANRVSQADYGTEDFVYEMNLNSAAVAKECANRKNRENPDKWRFVAGSVGPTNKSSSIPVVPEKPHKREISFDELAESYMPQVDGLIKGEADILLIETSFDTLNTKAAIFASLRLFEKYGFKIPVVLSFSLDSLGKRVLSGQSVEAFINSVSHADPLAMGLNCTGEGSLLKDSFIELSEISPYYTIFYPNAGTPDSNGEYSQTTGEFRSQLEPLLESGKINILGGCCGTSPDYIEMLSELAGKYTPKKPAKKEGGLKLSGLETLELKPGNLVIAGEKTNTAGSKAFAKSIENRDYEKSVSIARQQVENGAQILDVCVDDPLVDGKKAMRRILHSFGSDPVTSRVPVMIDSSDFGTAEAGLKCLQGKGVVNSINLKEGEEDFLEKARLVKHYGASVVVMPIDEKGQANSFKRKTSIASRAYKLLTEKADYEPSNILFDLNVMAVGTGTDVEEKVAADLVDTCRWINENLPGAGTVGGVSNLSFSFRGNNEIRSALHAVILEHLVEAGLSLAIVNPGEPKETGDFSSDLISLCEELLFRPSEKALNQLMEWSGDSSSQRKTKDDGQSKWRERGAEERLEYSLLHGITEYLGEDIDELCGHYEDPMEIIHGPLINAMKTIGELFEKGEIFLPQIIRSAGIMKKAVDHLQPKISESTAGTQANTNGKKLILATVEGDVHDIGKNIAKLVLSCYGYKIIDLGIMVPSKDIVDRAAEEKADLIGLSGLITPSLEKMGEVVQMLEDRGMNIPVIIGGAATSKRYTALRLDPLYSGAVVHVNDVAGAPIVARKLIYSDKHPGFLKKVKKQYLQIQEEEE